MLTSCGGFGPSAQKYLKHIYGRARENSCSDMGVGQPDIQTTGGIHNAQTYWNMRLSVAGAAKDAQVQNDILLSDFTRNHVVVGRQPHPDPNFASCGRGALIALLWRFRMPLEAPPGALSHFLLAECLWFSSLLLRCFEATKN